MALYRYECLNYPWTVCNNGVVSLSDKINGLAGAHTFAVHGLVVAAKYREFKRLVGSIMVTRGDLALVVSDIIGNRRLMYLRKDNLYLDQVKNAGQGKFMFNMVQAKEKSEDPIPDKIFWGTFCCSG
jgi:hypothetical protein